jgi:putative nucleotidyltransferase with HDIG domain
MMRPSAVLVFDGFSPPNDLRLILGEMFLLRWMPVDLWCDSNLHVCDLVVFDHSIGDERDFGALENWTQKAGWRPGAIHVAPNVMRRRLAGHGLLRTDYFCPRPLDIEGFARLALSIAQSRRQKSVRDDAWLEEMAGAQPSVIDSLKTSQAALDGLFVSAQQGGRIDAEALKTCAGSIAEVAASGDLQQWIDGVRRHHDTTYQHCLLVTGVAVGYAAFLGIGGAELERISTAALLHDVGKAHVPLAILDKPAALTPAEMDIIKTHPGSGAEALMQTNELDPRLIHAVRHHHEYLDGSGYPDKLAGADIPDLTRFITIADIYSALIEKRSYKPAMSSADAYGILAGMNGKLDMPLVKAFQPFCATM